MGAGNVVVGCVGSTTGGVVVVVGCVGSATGGVTVVVGCVGSTTGGVTVVVGCVGSGVIMVDCVSVATGVFGDLSTRNAFAG